MLLVFAKNRHFALPARQTAPAIAFVAGFHTGDITSMSISSNDILRIRGHASLSDGIAVGPCYWNYQLFRFTAFDVVCTAWLSPLTDILKLEWQTVRKIYNQCRNDSVEKPKRLHFQTSLSYRFAFGRRWLASHPQLIRVAYASSSKGHHG
jgi:hypothetical protein